MIFQAGVRRVFYIVSAIVALVVAAVQAFYSGSGLQPSAVASGILAALAVLGAGINTMAALNTPQGE